ncbi:MAG: PAS domain S-box protein [Lacibacter sp.]
MQQPINILILEDNPADAELIKRTISKAGIDYKNTSVDNRTDFIQQLKEQQFDLVLSDNTLPQFNAADAINIVRTDYPHLPFILVTGTANEDYIIEIMKLGIDDYILKDRLHRLPSAIKSVIKAKEIEKQKEQAQEELIKSEAKYRFLIEHISSGIYALDRNWNVLYMNKIAADLFKCDRDKIVGKNMWNEFPHLKLGKFYKAYLHAMHTQQEVFLEDYSEYFNIWGAVNAFPSPEGIVIVFRDVTEEKKAELAYLKSQEQYRQMVERISDSFISLDKDYNYVFLNQQAGDLIRMNPDELIGKNVWEVFPDVVGSSTYNSFIKAMKEQVYVSCVDYYQPLDLWQENHIYPSENGLSVFIRNISEQKRNEIAAKENEEVRNLIMSSALDAIICVDKESKVIFWNTRAEILFGWGFDEVKGKDISEIIIPPKYRAKHESGMNRYNESGETRISGKMKEMSALNRDGKEFPIEFFMIPIKSGTTEFFCAFIRDISERKDLEKKLITQQKAAAIDITLTALLAQEKERNIIGQELHDNVNQILAGTKMMLQLVKSNYKTNKDFLDKCIDNLGDAIRENRKIAHEMVTPDIKNQELTDLLKNLAEEMFNTQNIEVNIQHENFDENILTPNQKITLYRIAQEQCSNILKYASASRVLLNLENKNKTISFIIEDNGIGMNTDKKPEGIGLKNIKSRLSVFNGKSKIISSPGNGFALHVEIPVQEL